MLRRALAALALIAVSSAYAQESAEVADHFRLYSEAVQRGDFAAAESAAQDAWAASEARDGEGGRTAVLAFNLARLRANRSGWPEARAPAERAYTIARTRGGASGVDPLMSALMWGRVRVATEGFGGTGFLFSVLDDAAAREDLLGDRYDAADELGRWAMAMNRPLLARRAWSLAADAAAGAPYDAGFARGRARAYEGVAIAWDSFVRDRIMSPIDGREARTRLAEAHTLVMPFAVLGSADPALTHPQDVYALLLAYDTVVWGKLRSESPTRPIGDRLNPMPQTIDGAPVCPLRIGERTGMHYPPMSIGEGQVGAVVVRVRAGADSAVLGAEIAVAVGDERIERNVAEALPGWAISIESDAACRVAPNYFVPIAFLFEP